MPPSPSFSSMAGRSLPSDSSSLDVIEVVRKLQSVGFCSDLDLSVKNSGELSRLFNGILSLFSKEIHLRREIRPLPTVLGNGRSVDPFDLYRTVHVKGGYESVSAAHLWSSAAEELGFDAGFGPSLKLIYAKYLGALERWLCIVLDKKITEDLAEGKPDSVSFVGVSETGDNGVPDMVPTTPLGSKWNQFLTPSRGSMRKLQLDGGERGNGDDGITVERFVANGNPPLKRKREALVGMLNWVKMIAKSPKVASTGKVLKDGTNYKAHHTSELFSRVLCTRRLMFTKKITRIHSDEHLLQEGETYADCVGFGTQIIGKDRCIQGLEFINKHSGSGSCSKTSTLSEYDMNTDIMADGEEFNCGKRGLKSKDQQQQRRVPVGPSFQVVVPGWNGKPSDASFDSDNSKWLGRRIWPPEDQDNKRPSKQSPIGKGREETCQCQHPASVECVRFHVAEKRLELKRELGPTFFLWKFNHMGEEVSLSWTEEEECKFKAIVQNPQSQSKSLWHQLYICFPIKGRQKLVSYYFNVYLLARRSYQNRVTPSRVDSDDEETEFGFLSCPFGHDAVRAPNPKSIFCVQNSQCMDLD